MTTKKPLQSTKYNTKKYGIATSVPFEGFTNYATVLMAIAGADGELSKDEIQWFIDEQELSYTDATECVKAVDEINRSGTWKNVDIEKKLSAIQDTIDSMDGSENFVDLRHTLLYQAIKMCRADKDYHKDEQAAVSKAAQTLGIQPDVVANIESIAELEDTVERLRYSLLRAKA